MKTLVTVAVSLVLAFASIAHAQSAAPAPVKATHNVSGTVRSASSDLVVVAGRDKGKDAEWTFAVEPTTNIRKGSKSIVASDLKPGDAIQVRYVEREGKATAQSIIVKGPKKGESK